MEIDINRRSVGSLPGKIVFGDFANRRENIGESAFSLE
jgi:hypothetical protein